VPFTASSCSSDVSKFVGYAGPTGCMLETHVGVSSVHIQALAAAFYKEQALCVDVPIACIRTRICRGSDVSAKTVEMMRRIRDCCILELVFFRRVMGMMLSILFCHHSRLRYGLG
jgi:hypothetical protein